MRLGGAGRRAGARGTLDGAKIEPSGLREAFESRQNVTCRAHISRLFLNPDNFSRVGMLFDGGGNFRARQRVELVEKEYGGIRVCAAVEGWQICMLSSAASCMKRSIRALECSGPWPS